MNPKRLRRTSALKHVSVLVLIHFLALFFKSACGVDLSTHPGSQLCKSPGNCADPSSSTYTSSSKHQKRSPVFVKPDQSVSQSRHSYLNHTDSFNRAVRQAFHTLPQHLAPVNTSSYNANNYNANQYHQYPEAVPSLPQQNSYYKSAEPVNTQNTNSQGLNYVHNSYDKPAQQQSTQTGQNVGYEPYYPPSGNAVPTVPTSNIGHRDGYPYYQYSQEHLNDHETQFSYETTLNDVYPNGTSDIEETQLYKEYLDREDDGSHAQKTHHLEEVHPTGLFNYYTGYGKYPKDVGVDASQLDVELSERKVTFFLVALWYIFIVMLVSSGGFTAGPACDGPPPHEFPLIHVRVRPDPVHFDPYGETALQEEMYDMFSSYDEDSSDEDSGEYPDLSKISQMCGKGSFFYGLNPNHMMAVEMAKEILMRQAGPTEVMHMAKVMRKSRHVHPKVWYEAMTKMHFEREDMAGMLMPGPLDAMPDTFIPGESLDKGFRSLRSLGRSGKKGKKGKQKCVKVDGKVGRDNGPNNILWYFREDVMVNTHHWYWHMSFPLVNSKNVLRDRRGELFYFMHNSMVNRFNMERLSLGLPFSTALDFYPGAVVPEGYNTHLDDINSGQSWTDRPPHTMLSDVMHQDDPATREVIIMKRVAEVEGRLRKAIHTGYFVTPKGKARIPHDPLGIDILGNTLEATDYSINPMYYDETGYHNSGHRIIGYSVDPNFEKMLPPGVMADAGTAMRDPVFYRWHTKINQIFGSYKHTLKPYQPSGGEWPLRWDGVSVTDINVFPDHGKSNHLHTFFSQKKFDLALGLAFKLNDTQDDLPDYVPVCATHMNHEEFSYEIHLERLPCAKSHSDSATVRIFIAPRYNLHGKRFTMEEQGKLFVHLDMFKTQLKVGKTVITRHSTDSALTNTWAKSLATLRRELGNNPESPNCGCGWPHHLLLPRGTPDGMAFDIFVMVTNGDEDAVFEKEQNPFGSQCRPAPIYCGIGNRKYPDARPMGYPFDRPLFKVPHGCEKWKGGHPILEKFCSWFTLDWRPPFYLENYVHGIPNMGFTKVTIRHVDH